MSVIGPRPALWNQDVLIAEREKYHATTIYFLDIFYCCTAINYSK